MSYIAKLIVSAITSKIAEVVTSAIALFFKNRKTDKKIEETTSEKNRTKAAADSADILFDD